MANRVEQRTPAALTNGRDGGVTSTESRRPFGAVVRDLLIERGYVTGIGNPNWSGFASELSDVSYETLRKAVTGEREPGRKVMEVVAAFFGESPDIFWEYQLVQAQEAFDPRVVGEDVAYANLLAWLAQKKK